MSTKKSCSKIQYWLSLAQFSSAYSHIILLVRHRHRLGQGKVPWPVNPLASKEAESPSTHK